MLGLMAPFMLLIAGLSEIIGRKPGNEQCLSIIVSHLREWCLRYPGNRRRSYGTNVSYAYDQVHNVIQYTMDYCYTAREKGDQ